MAHPKVAMHVHAKVGSERCQGGSMGLAISSVWRSMLGGKDKAGLGRIEECLAWDLGLVGKGFENVAMHGEFSCVWAQGLWGSKK